VIVDGRIVYTEAFGGVYWDTVDVPLEDIDRIRSDPWARKFDWGANAVNGVISIFTQARRGENEEGPLQRPMGNRAGMGTAEYGDALGKQRIYRVFAKYDNQGQMHDLNGQSGYDGWHALRGGFSNGQQPHFERCVNTRGDLYTEREGELAYFLRHLRRRDLITLPGTMSLRQAVIQAKLEHQYKRPRRFELQISFTNYHAGRSP